MDVTMETVRSVLAPDEPDYPRGKELGPAALPFLAVLVKDKDKMMASKAASLAGMIGGAGAADVLESASRHPEMAVRAAAAHGAPSLPQSEAESLLMKLMDDREPAVSHRAILAARRVPTEKIRQKLRSVHSSHSAAFVRQAAEEALKP